MRIRLLMAIGLVVSVASGVAGPLLLQGVEVKPDFYAATSTIIPILLLTMVTGMGRWRGELDVSRDALRGIDHRLRKLVEEINELEIMALDAQDLQAQAHALRARQQIDSLSGIHDENWGTLRRTSRVMVIGLMIGVFVAAAGEIAALYALGSDSSSGATLYLSSYCLFAMLLLVVTLEILDYVRA